MENAISVCYNGFPEEITDIDSDCTDSPSDCDSNDTLSQAINGVQDMLQDEDIDKKKR